MLTQDALHPRTCPAPSPQRPLFRRRSHRRTHRQCLPGLSRALGLWCMLTPVCVWASSGDRQPAFLQCLAQCQRTGCAPWLTHEHRCHPALACRPDSSKPWALRVAQWSCLDDCRYLCMLEIERYRAGQGWPSQKYYGKWPFQRILGIQEVASVVFSLLNLSAHVLGVRHIWQAQRSLGQQQQKQPGRGSSDSDRKGEGRVQGSPAAYPYLWVWTLYCCLHAVAWAASALFHTRDTPLTEKIDYCLAISVVYSGLYTVVVRVFSVQRPLVQLFTLLGPGAGLAWHLHHMLKIKFDYSWNVKVCTVVGILSAVLWLGWLLTAARQHPGRGVLFLFLVLVHGALLLELLDFPPKMKLPALAEATSELSAQDMLSGLGLVDAHSLWHLATVPLTTLFIHFIVLDMSHWATPRQKTSHVD